MSITPVIHRPDKLLKNIEDATSRVDEFIFKFMNPREPKLLYDAANHIIRAGGKRLRPYLVLKCCELVGGDEGAALPFAAAVEILHTFTLIHDDIMDGDELRRGVPTVHVKWGIPIGIAAGDLLFAKVYEAILKRGSAPPDTILRCLERLTDAAIAICEGQILDISYPSAAGVTEEDYLRMIGLKTATLFQASAEVGAIAGRGDDKMVGLLGEYAYNLGLSFQLVDDYLGLTSDEETLGKPVGSDLKEGKKTLIIIHANKMASPSEWGVIGRILGDRYASKEDIEKARIILEELGSIEYTLNRAREYAERARRILENLPKTDAREELYRLTEFVVKRRT
ncbi:MAG: polyprenyl synthetase family protein [Candidatus Bathyarchaeia archaeon]